MNNCIGDNTVVAFIEGVLAAEHAARVERHAAACAPCRLRLAVAGASRSQVARALTAPAGLCAPADEWPVRGLVGRFETRYMLGRGGMGVVFAAHDPKLERNVALKLLHGTSPHQARVAEAQARLLAEARALARLSHPNIVTVYEADTFQGETCIVMELVHGVTLTSWLRRWARPWSSVVDAFVQAGRALAHAHAHGLAHGDFKPDNVLVDDSDRVRVMDFGLARSLAPDRSSAEPRLMMGTPRYMAPEQFRGQPADERSDQFGFCVALYEALVGEHPCAHDTPMSLLKLPAEQAFRPLPPAARELPRWLLAAVRTGLSVEPTERYRSMSELLWALTLPPQPQWLRLRLTAIGALVALAVVGGVSYVLGAQGHRQASRLAGPAISERLGEPRETTPPPVRLSGSGLVRRARAPDGGSAEMEMPERAGNAGEQASPDLERGAALCMHDQQSMFAPGLGARDSLHRIEFFHDLLAEELRLARGVLAILRGWTDTPGELLGRLEQRLDRLEGMQTHSSGLLARLRQQLAGTSKSSPELAVAAPAPAAAQPLAGKAQPVWPRPAERTSGLSESAVTSGVYQRWRDIEACFREWRERQPSGDYTLSVDLRIDADGTARRTGQDGISDKVVKQCVSGALEDVRFAAARTTTAVTVPIVSSGSSIRLEPLAFRGAPAGELRAGGRARADAGASAGARTQRR